jgi:hypothetical protein
MSILQENLDKLTADAGSGEAFGGDFCRALTKRPADGEVW